MAGTPLGAAVQPGSLAADARDIRRLGLDLARGARPRWGLERAGQRSLPDIQSLAVSKPEDLDTLMDQIGSAGTWQAEPAMHQGEHLYMSERVVVSPSSGIFSPEASLHAPETGLLPGTGNDLEQSSAVEVGDLVGRVGSLRSAHPVRRQVIRWLAPTASGSKTVSRSSGCACPIRADGVVLVTGGNARHRRGLRGVVPGNGDSVATT